MYAVMLEQLIEPIFFAEISDIEIREVTADNIHYELIVMVPNDLIKKIIGSKGNLIRSLTTIINVKAQMENHIVKIVVNEL